MEPAFYSPNDTPQLPKPRAFVLQTTGIWGAEVCGLGSWDASLELPECAGVPPATPYKQEGSEGWKGVAWKQHDLYQQLQLVSTTTNITKSRLILMIIYNK